MKCAVCGREFDPEKETWEIVEPYGPVCEWCLDNIVYSDDEEDEEYSIEEWEMEHPLE